MAGLENLKGGKNLVYQYKKGVCYKTPAQIAGEICAALESDGGLTPERLLEFSRPTEAPLHEEFEWNDAIAAEKYRTDQASGIIRSIEIQIEGHNGNSELTRAFVNLTRSEHEYRDITIVIENPSEREILFRRVYSELLAFRKKHAILTEFADIWDAIDKIQSA